MSTIEPKCLQDKRAKLKKEGKRATANLPALARREYEFMKNLKTHEGYGMVGFDFVSLEPTVTAAWSNDPMYVYAVCGGIGKRPYFSRGVLMIDDVYLMMASQLPFRDELKAAFDEENLYDVWLEDTDKVKKHPRLKSIRSISKTACLGLERGMGPAKLAKDIRAQTGYNMSLAEAKDIKKSFWNFFEGVDDLRRGLEAKVTQKGYFVTVPFGFKVNCDPYKAYAHFTQAQASGVIEILMLKFFTIAKDYTIFHALIHDEVCFSYKLDHKERMMADMQACLDSLNEDLKWSVPMRLGHSMGFNFGDVK